MASNDYITKRSLETYMLFHYGPKDRTMNWDFGPTNGLEFPLRCAELCEKHWKKLGNSCNVPLRALDIGCAVGRSTFELSRTFDEVLGIDYSQLFVTAAQTLAITGKLAYSWLDHGDIAETLMAKVDNEIDRSKVRFQHGDACNLPADVGEFHCVLAANLICRLRRPRDFLYKMRDIIVPGGILVLTSPYSFSPQFTDKEDLIGGIVHEDGTHLTAFQGLKNILEPDFTLIEESNMPFSIKETARYHQWTVAHATVWQKK